MILNDKTLAGLKRGLVGVLEDYGEKGITDKGALEDVKTALSALEKLICLCALDELAGGNSYDDGGDSSNDGYSRNNVREKLYKMRDGASSARERKMFDSFINQL